jgi:serine/threonine protein kinase
MSGDPFDLIGQVIGGQFRVETLAGDADLSVVYRARRLDSTLSVAVKLLCVPETIPDALARALETAFYQAYRVHDRLARGNLNIAQTFMSGEVFSPRTGVAVPYLVREWLEGESLASELAARANGIRPMRPLQEVLGLLHGAFDAVAFAHSEGETHLGINPGNLFVANRSDGSASLKVLDFGLARMMNDFSPESPSESHSGCGLRLLLAGYAAPEQIDETLGPVGPRSDVYALATVAMEALSGHKLPPVLEQVLSRALSTEPQTRQEDAVELWREMSSAVSPRPPRAAVIEAAETPAAVVVGAVGRPRLKVPVDASTDTQPMTFESGPPSPTHVPTLAPPDVHDPLSMPPSKIPSLIPPELSVGSHGHPTSDRGKLTSLPWRWIAIGVGGIAAASLIGIGATTALRSRRPSAATAITAGDNPPVSSASSSEASPLASSVPRSTEKEPPAAQTPPAESVATTASERPTPFAPGTAKRALDSKRPELTKCRRGKAWGYGLATVTFGNDGSVDKVALAPPLAGTLTGECAKGTLVAARIAPFVGSPRSVAYKFYVAPK